MSAPKPLYSLVEQWRNQFGIYGDSTFIECAAELETALQAWDEEFKPLDTTRVTQQTIYRIVQQILGLPAKEARPSRSKESAESTKTQKILADTQK